MISTGSAGDRLALLLLFWRHRCFISGSTVRFIHCVTIYVAINTIGHRLNSDMDFVFRLHFESLVFDQTHEALGTRLSRIINTRNNFDNLANMTMLIRASCAVWYVELYRVEGSAMVTGLSFSRLLTFIMLMSFLTCMLLLLITGVARATGLR